MSGERRAEKPVERSWPSLAAQLVAAGVVHGSALERLIEANQETHLLRPGESPDDDIDLPLWLRVHYRKHHPELTPAPAGPACDYPNVLENLYGWMILNQDLSEAGSQ